MGRENPKIVIACTCCKSTGVIQDNSPGVGVVCAGCNGKGFVEQYYEPFTGRKKCIGIVRVRRSGQGLTAFSLAPSHDAGVTYDDFLRGKMP